MPPNYDWIDNVSGDGDQDSGTDNTRTYVGTGDSMASVQHNVFIQTNALIDLINTEQKDVMNRVAALQQASTSISIADMFDLQMRMNKLSQFSEMCSAIVSTTNSAIGKAISGIRSQ